MGLHDFSFYDLINRNAVTFCNHVCWREADNGAELTFSEYKEQVDRLAAGLSQDGVEEGARIGVVGKSSLEFFLIYGAASALGAIVVPINWSLSGHEICADLNDCQPRIVFVDEEFQQTIDSEKSKLTSVAVFYNLRSGRGGYGAFDQLLAQDKHLLDDRAKNPDGFVIIYTDSAEANGRSRGALISHANVLSASMHFIYYMDITPADVHLNLLPFFHICGLLLAVSTFHAGGVNLNIPSFDAGKVAPLIQREGVTLFFDNSSVLDAILNASKEKSVGLRSLKAVVGHGNREVIERFQEDTNGFYYYMYGHPETTCLTTLGKYNHRPGSVGKIALLADVRLVDDEGTIVKSGKVGEITVKGPMVFKGYWNRAKENATVFKDGWYHTGDMGRFDAEGFMFYAGRRK